MNRSGALKLTAIVVVFVLCLSSLYIGLQLSQKGKSSPSIGDVSPVPPTDVPLNTGESPAVSVPSSPSVSVPSTGDSTVQQPVTNQDVGTTTTDPIVVGPVASTTVTQLSADGIILGNYVYDTAIVSGQAGISTPTGTVTFEVKAPGAASFVPYGTSGPVAIDVTGKAVSENYYPTIVGSYYFLAIYSGDSNYKCGQSPADAELLNVAKASTFTSTSLNGNEGPFILGNSVYDTAKVIALDSALPTPTGTVTFQVSADNGASWTMIGSPVALVDGQAASQTYQPSMAGQYEFRALYSGDCNFVCSSSGVCDEPLKVLMAQTTTTTNFGPCEITVGQSVKDNATVIGVAGSPAPSGTVTYYISTDSGASWTMLGCGPATLDANGKAQSDWYTPATSGYVFFKAVYSGDNNYQPSVSDISTERLMVDCASSVDTSSALS